MDIMRKNRNRGRGSITQELTDYQKSWQGWLDEDRTFLSVSENAILECGKDAEIGGAQC